MTILGWWGQQAVSNLKVGTADICVAMGIRAGSEDQLVVQLEIKHSSPGRGVPSIALLYTLTSILCSQRRSPLMSLDPLIFLPFSTHQGIESPGRRLIWGQHLASGGPSLMRAR